MPGARPTVILGISGSIAAYKACDLIRLLREAEVRVIPAMTRAATQIIPPLTIGVLAGEPVYVDPFDPKHNEGVDHIGIVQDADCFVLAPASANSLAKLALGLADDYPSLLATAFPAPRVIAPAMNSRMYANPVVQAHLDTLRQRGAVIVEPTTGLLACGEVGIGKLAPVEAIRDAILQVLARGKSLNGLRVLITAGGTREPIDAVRYLGNRSSGRMGTALAEAAAARGAEVTLVTTTLPYAVSERIRVVRVETVDQMQAALAAAQSAHDVLLMTAAVSDFAPAPRAGKLHRDREPEVTLQLTRTPDLLKEAVARRSATQLIVGFAAEVPEAREGEEATLDLAERARAKLQGKGCDLVVANDVSRADIGFGSSDNAVVLVDRLDPSSARVLERAPKRQIAEAIWDRLLDLRALLKTSRTASGRDPRPTPSSMQGAATHAAD